MPPMISSSISAEMLGFELLDPTNTGVPHITPLTNLTLSNLQRGHFEVRNDNGRFTNSIYDSPPLELYTRFPLQLYFFAFWGILLLQVITIFIIDMKWARNIPRGATLHSAFACIYSKFFKIRPDVFF